MASAWDATLAASAAAKPGTAAPAQPMSAWDATLAANPRSLVDQIPGYGDGNTQTTPAAPQQSWLDTVKSSLSSTPIGMIVGMLGGRPAFNPAQEAAVSTVGGMGAGVVGAGAGLAYGVTHDIGTPQGARNAENFGANITDALTPQPRSQIGRDIAGHVNDFMNDSGIIGLGPTGGPAADMHALRAAADARYGAPVAAPPPVVPRINYDVPTFIRRAAADRAEAPAPVIVPELSPGYPTLPAAPQSPQSPLDQYIADTPTHSPFGTVPPLDSPTLPDIPASPTGQSPLDQAIAGGNIDTATPVIYPPSTTPVTPLQAEFQALQSRGDQIRAQVHARDPFLGFLAKNGVSLADRNDIGVEPGNAGNLIVPGYGQVIRNNGLRLDELALKAQEDGHLTQADIDNPLDPGGTQKIADMVNRAVGNREMVRTGNLDSQMLSHQDAAMYDEAHQLGIDTTSLTPDQVYDSIVAHHSDAQEPITAYQEHDPLQAHINAAFDNARLQGPLTDEQINRLFEPQRTSFLLPEENPTATPQGGVGSNQTYGSPAGAVASQNGSREVPVAGGNGRQAQVGSPLDRYIASGAPAPFSTPIDFSLGRRAPVVPPAADLAGVGAARSNLDPYSGQLTGEEAARGGSSAFPQVKLAMSSGDAPLAEQRVRAMLFNELMGPDNDGMRTGVLTGNEDTLRAEYVDANHPDKTPARIDLHNQIANEQRALSRYAQERIDATGANQHLTNNEQRGQVINDAFHGEGGLSGYFKAAEGQIYDKAEVDSGGNPIATSHINTQLSDPQFLAEAERNGHTGVVSGAQKLIDLARTVGFKDPLTGEVAPPGSVAAWRAVRKSNNAGWTPDNSRTIAAINRAIDQDVAAAAGSDAYKLGDAIHRAQKTIMDTPAISKIFGGEDENGIKDGVALEKLPGKLNNMQMDQWRHIYNTLDDLSRGRVRGAPEGMPAVPQQLQQMALAAKNEMQGALAREVYEQGAGKVGVWNQNSVNKMLNSVVGQKILETFSPDEVRRFHVLNYSGQIMPGIHPYEGSALQHARADNPGLIEKYAPAGAIAAGVKVGGPLGVWVGKSAGDKISQVLKEKRLEAQARHLREVMKLNADLDKK